jgi:hypothetical protein
MDRYLERGSVVSAASLVGKEGMTVDFVGALITSKGTGCYGVISRGRPAGASTEIIMRGQTEVYVDGSSTNIAVNDPLTAGGGTATDTEGDTISGFTKATIGTHPIRAYAMEAATTATQIKVFML